LQANGGAGVYSGYLSGGGGGGIISIVDSGTDTYSGTVQVAGSGAGGVGVFNLQLSSGSAICDSGNLGSTCTISTRRVLPSSYSIGGAGNLVLSAAISTAGDQTQGISVAMTGDVTVQSGGSIGANVSSLTAANFNLNSGGSVSLTGLGYAGGVTANGSGTGGGVSKGGGGGYGGAGAAGGAGGAGG